KAALARARQQERLAVAGRQAFDALALASTDPQRSLDLAVEAAAGERSPGLATVLERVLRTGLLASHELRSIQIGTPALAMAVSADGARAAVATTGAGAALVDLAGRRTVATLAAGAPLRSIAIS